MVSVACLKTIETPYDVPKAEKGLLKVLYPEVYIAKAGSPKLNDKKLDGIYKS